jgi:AcrR family transcriptional regulator
LEATEKRLVEVGPGGLRLADLAADLGITHQAILHHFGSREDLLAELARSVIASLGQELITALDREEEPPSGPTDLLDRVFQAFGERGQARLIAWLALSGLTPAPSRRAAKTEASQVLLRLAEVLHSRWGKAARGASFENTQFTIVLGSLAVFGDAITGAAVRHSAGLGNDRDTNRRFRAWLSRLLAAQVRS